MATTTTREVSRLGRPSTFSQAVADEICERITCGESMRTISAADNMPDTKTIFNWLNRFPEFVQQYARAKEMRAHARFERIDGVILDMRDDIIDAHKARVEIDAIKWQCGRELPASYGDQIKVEHSGGVGILSVAEILRQRENALNPQPDTGQPLSIDSTCETRE